MFRLWLLVVFRSGRAARLAAHAHEGGPSLVLPLVVLAVLAAVLGGYTTVYIPRFLAHVLSLVPGGGRNRAPGHSGYEPDRAGAGSGRSLVAFTGRGG